jgi:pimeloyl-ACP methyl ester carboxylesterase
VARVLGILAAVLVTLVLAIVATGLLYRPDPGPLRLTRDTVTVDGTRLGYHRRGTGPDVVLVHGGMGSAEDFEPVLERLAARFRVTAVDRPGFGLSEARGEDVTYPGNARLLAGLVRATGVARPVIVGHSHGGGVALQLALDHPDLPAGLVLLAPAAYPGDDAGITDRLLALPLVGEGVAAWAGPVIGPASIAAILEPMIAPDAARLPRDFVAYRQQLWTNPRSLAVHSRQVVTDTAGLARIAARLPAVRVPTSVLGCAQDPTEGHDVDSRRVARELPAADLRWLEGCGHYIQYARPDEVVTAIEQVARRSGVAAAPGEGVTP